MKPEDIFHGFQDHREFCRRSLIVETEGRELIPMAFADPAHPAYSPGQVRLNDAIRKQRAAGRPVRLIYLKSRRIRATTGTAAHFFQGTAFHAGVHTVVLGHDETSTQNIFSIYERFHNNYTPFGEAIKLPKARVMSDRIYYEYGGDSESSFIQIHTAGSANFGRSFRITNVHFSEFPYYPDPGGILAAVMSAVPKTADTTAVVEGTAKTLADYFQKMWQSAIDQNADSEWIGLFMGWWEHPANRMELAIPRERFQDMLNAAEREIMLRHGLSLEQMAWRRWTIVNDFNGETARFRREHPATPEEAFMASGRNRFSIPHIQRMPVQRDPIVGELKVEEVGVEERVVFVSSDTGALKVYRRPERGRCYAAGADPSGGADANKGKGEADSDWAVCHILDRDTGEQCAVLRLRCMPGEFGRYVYRLLRWYNNAQVCLERNGAGVGTLEALLNCNYPPALVYHRPTAPDQDPEVRSDRIGWNTDEVSRQQALSMLDDAIRYSTIFVHDPVTQYELMVFVINARGKAEAQQGCHDDTVLALSFAVVVMARMPRPLAPKDQRPPVLGKYGQRQPDGDRRGEVVRVRR